MRDLVSTASTYVANAWLPLKTLGYYQQQLLITITVPGNFQAT